MGASSMNQYIPKDLDDAIQILMKELSPEDLERIKRGNVSDYHHNLGRCMRNNWGLWSNSRLAYWFNDTLGVKHPDDASNIVMVSLKRKLRGEDIDLAGQVRECAEYWASIPKTSGSFNIICTKEEIKILK